MTGDKGSTTQGQVITFRREIRQILQDRLKGAIELLLEGELEGVLASRWYERTDRRRGYRNGSRRRRVTTQAGTRELKVPRARLTGPDGGTREFHSELLPRYARRTRPIDEAIPGIYLSGANSRRKGGIQQGRVRTWTGQPVTMELRRNYSTRIETHPA